MYETNVFLSMWKWARTNGKYAISNSIDNYDDEEMYDHTLNGAPLQSKKRERERAGKKAATNKWNKNEWNENGMVTSFRGSTHTAHWLHAEHFTDVWMWWCWLCACMRMCVNVLKLSSYNIWMPECVNVYFTAYTLCVTSVSKKESNVACHTCQHTLYWAIV